MKPAREDDVELAEEEITVADLLPELRAEIRTFLPSFARIQMQRVSKLWWEEDKTFVAPACIIPPVPLAVKRHLDVRGTLLELMEPCNKPCLEWIKSLGQNYTRVYPNPLGWDKWPLGWDKWEWSMRFFNRNEWIAVRCYCSKWRLNDEEDGYPLQQFWVLKGAEIQKAAEHFKSLTS